MTPFHHPSANVVLVAPEGWDEGDCDDLRVHQADGVMSSFWRPSWPERLAILLGRPVRLAIVSDLHPPVWLDTNS